MGECVDTRYAFDLKDIYTHIDEICAAGSESNLLWFRGQEYDYYNLEPNLFRNGKYKFNSKKMYSSDHLREEYRFQNFMSRNFDKLGDGRLQTMIEWQEVMQHYGTKTRLMDWSESLIVALGFALEAFIKPKDDLEVKKHRETATPTLWILKPVELNRKVYKCFLGDEAEELIERALPFSDKRRILAESIKMELQSYQEVYFNLKEEEELEVMLSLAGLEIIRDAYRGREEAALGQLEMNPFFYLLLRYYSDGVPVQENFLPPLAIIHPYHSPRIRNQKGVFTIFPYYIKDCLHRKMEDITKQDEPVAMEYMKDCIPTLHKIQILNPQKVAEELMQTGARRRDLYPDMQSISEDFEYVIK